ncbi:Sialidase precursor [Anaerohalosphaera lusitana]|uniref:exo-alpha-sialidase n=1 Tax=Anaerohalosphaera lusitana TaxID=1936003 RepID=A0A1U9NK47_9BACT|nr:sialidase family protein [Anaerohalosphaera lusitana]AQT68187.1 Sialidase precursor [Anaerohalosphaera lusitana]
MQNLMRILLCMCLSLTAAVYAVDTVTVSNTPTYNYANGIYGQSFTPSIGADTSQLTQTVLLQEFVLRAPASRPEEQYDGAVYLNVYENYQDASNYGTLTGSSSNTVNPLTVAGGDYMYFQFDVLEMDKDTQYAVVLSTTAAAGDIVNSRLQVATGDPYAGGQCISVSGASDWEAEFIATMISGDVVVLTNHTDGDTNVVEAGQGDTYDLMLVQEITSNLTVTVTPDAQLDLGSGAGQAINVTFIPGGAESISIDVAAVDDSESEGPHTGTIQHDIAASEPEFASYPVDPLTVNIEDNERYCGDDYTTFLSADLNQDCYVDFNDFALVASNWLQCSDPTDIECLPNVPGLPPVQTDLFVGTGIAGGTEDNPAHTYRIPAMETTSTGTIIAVADARVNNSGDLPGAIDVAIRRSFDNGKTWTPVRIIVDYPGSEGAGDPCILVDKQTDPDTIYIFYLYGPEGIGLWQSQPGLDGPSTCQIQYVKSTDDGDTWTQPVNLNPQVKNPDWGCALASPGNALQMRDGTLVVPAYYRKTNGVMQSYFFYSVDHGQTWQYSNAPGELQNSASTTECAIVELEDGGLILNMRNHRGQGSRAISKTYDMGQTWTPIEHDFDLPEPVCQAALIRMTDTRDGYERSRVLFSNPASSSGRVNMKVKLSYDGCDTWPVAKQIHAGSSAYSSMTILENGNIGLLYEADSYSKIVFAEISLKWLTDNQDWLPIQ